VTEQPAYTCGRCGGPNPAGSYNCQWCRSELAPIARPPPEPTHTFPFDRLLEEASKIQPEDPDDPLPGIIGTVIFTVGLISSVVALSLR
jgi:hypothetical protein